MAYAPIVVTAGNWIAGGDTTKVISPAIDTTGADLLLIMASYFNGQETIDASDVSDSKGNSYTALTNWASTGAIAGSSLLLFYNQGGTVGASHTAQIDSTLLTVPAMAFGALSGSVASPFDQENGNQPSSDASTRNTNSVTPSEDNEILIACACSADAQSGDAVDDGFTIWTQLDGVAGQALGLILAYKIQTSAGAEDPTFTINETYLRTASISTFKAAAAAGGQPTMRRWGGTPFMGGQGIGNKGPGRGWG